MIGLIKSYGKLIVTTEYANVPMDTLEKVNYSLEHKSAFGLEDPDGGMWIISFKPMVAAHYWTHKQDHTAMYDNYVDLELLVMRLLYTHTNFVGPHMIHKFLIACKELNKIDDEHTQQLSREIMPDAERKNRPAGGR